MLGLTELHDVRFSGPIKCLSRKIHIKVLLHTWSCILERKKACCTYSKSVCCKVSSSVFPAIFLKTYKYVSSQYHWNKAQYSK